MNPPTASNLFNHFVAVIDQAEQDKNFRNVIEAADAAGMQKAENPYGMGQRYDFTWVDSGGNVLVVHVRWWDQSKTFSVRPDMHVMSAVLIYKGSASQHEKRYEE